MSVGVEIQGEDGIGAAIQASLNAALRGLDGASVSVVAGGARGQSRNTLIAKIQAKQLRDPFYLDQDAREAIQFAINGLMSAQYAVRRRALVLVGDLMLNAVGRNVERQENPGGQSFKALTAKYAAAKRRKFGFVTPILKATGDLLGGLRVVIEGLK